MTEFSRRQFIGAAAAGALAGAVRPGAAAGATKSRVVKVESPRWRLASGQVHPGVVRQMVNAGMMRVTGKSTPEAAWRELFSPGEVVGVKFNKISRDYSGANQALVDAIAMGLTAAGVQQSDIIVLEAAGATFHGGTPQKGWAREYDFGSGKTLFSNLLVNQLDAIINVPNPKHHPIASFTGALKNISHAEGTFMQGAGEFHRNKCDPYVADINALDVVRTKVRVHLCNGLMGIFDRGAYPQPGNQWINNALYLSFDPVAMDTILAQVVDKARVERNRPPLQNPDGAISTIATAAKRGLGTSDLARIEVASLKL